jgi:hypothetical protein
LGPLQFEVALFQEAFSLNLVLLPSKEAGHQNSTNLIYWQNRVS